MSIYDKASLVLIPSGTKTSKVYSQKPVNGDGDFTFSRSTAATRVNADGNIEKETQNLLLQSNSFTTGWGLSNVTMTSGQAGYDGTNDAWLMTDTNSGGYGIVDRLVTTGGITTFSCYAKSGTTDIFGLRPIGGSSPYVFFDLSNGTFESAGDTANLIDWDIQDAGNGWYRCSVTTSATATQVLIYIAITGGGLAPSGSTIYIQDAQVEQGLVARDYIETTTAAVEGGITDNVPRLDYTDSSCPALLLEPQRTNLITQSEYFNSWATISASVASNAATSPEGVQNASKLVEAIGSSFHFITSTPTIASGSVTFSFYAKSAERTSVSAFLTQSGNNGANFDLSAETATAQGTGNTASIEDVGDGWYRCVVTNSGSAQVASQVRIGVQNGALDSYVGDGTSGVYIYGAQVESGSYATSYIPTYGTSVTRNADDCRITGISDVISSSEYTLFWEGSHIPTGEYNSFATIFNNSAVNQSSRFYRNNTDNQIYAAAFISGSSVTLGSGVTDEYAKCAFRVKSGDFALYVNGSLVASSTSTMTPSATLDSISMQYFYSSQSFYQRTDQFMFFNQALSNEELADLTTI
jgi:hypothetical protein